MIQDPAILVRWHHVPMETYLADQLEVMETMIMALVRRESSFPPLSEIQ